MHVAAYSPQGAQGRWRLRGLVCVPFPIDDGFALVASPLHVIKKHCGLLPTNLAKNGTQIVNAIQKFDPFWPASWAWRPHGETLFLSSLHDRTVDRTHVSSVTNR